MENIKYVLRTCQFSNTYSKLLSEHDIVDCRVKAIQPMEVVKLHRRGNMTPGETVGYLAVVPNPKNSEEALVYFVFHMEYETQEVLFGVMPRVDNLLQAMGYTVAASYVYPHWLNAFCACGWRVLSSDQSPNIPVVYSVGGSNPPTNDVEQARVFGVTLGEQKIANAKFTRSSFEQVQPSTVFCGNCHMETPTRTRLQTCPHCGCKLRYID